MAATQAPALSSERRGRASIDVLIVGDAVADLGGLERALGERGMAVQRAHEPEAVAAAVVGGHPDAIVVDLRDDDGIGDRILSWICRNSPCDAVVVTRLDEVDARLRAVNRGACDHLVAPFEVREALARVQLAASRRREVRRTRLELGDLTIDAAQRCAFRSDETVPLTPREVDVLVVLAEHANAPVSKKVLLSKVWHDEIRTENIVEANVSSLRRKLHAVGPPVIHTLHRTGYVLRPVSPSAALNRNAVVAERDRLVRERDEMIARRDELIQRLRSQLGEPSGAHTRVL